MEQGSVRVCGSCCEEARAFEALASALASAWCAACISAWMRASSSAATAASALAASAALAASVQRASACVSLEVAADTSASTSAIGGASAVGFSHELRAPQDVGERERLQSVTGGEVSGCGEVTVCTWWRQRSGGVGGEGRGPHAWIGEGEVTHCGKGEVTIGDLYGDLSLRIHIWGRGYHVWVGGRGMSGVLALGERGTSPLRSR